MAVVGGTRRKESTRGPDVVGWSSGRSWRLWLVRAQARQVSLAASWPPPPAPAIRK